MKIYAYTTPNGDQIAVEVYQRNYPEIHRAFQSRYESNNPGKETEIRLRSWSNKVLSGFKLRSSCSISKLHWPFDQKIPVLQCSELEEWNTLVCAAILAKYSFETLENSFRTSL